jgi:ribosomal protein S12 methylthiotransferase accessory factor
VAVVPEEGIFVLSGSKETLLRGRLYELVAPHVDGRTPDEICDLLTQRVSAAEVYYTLGQLEKRGYLAEADDGLPAATAAWWSMQQIDTHAASYRLATVGVTVRGIGVDVEPLVEALAGSGVLVTDGDGSEVSVDRPLIIAVDHYLQPELAAVNSTALAGGRPWLLVKPVGQQVWLGPLFHPGATGCWRCLAERLRANRAVESYLVEREALGGSAVAEQAHLPASLQAACGLTATAVAQWIVRGELPDYEGKIRTFDLLSWQTQTHTLSRLPYCPACGHGKHGHTNNGHVRQFRPLELQSRQRKTFVRDGGHRVVDPQATIDRFSHHVSSITGAVSMLERTGKSDDGAMHVYLSGNNLARHHHSLGQLRSDLRNMSAGKGTTDAQAKASGLCEGLERYSGVFRGDEPRRRGSMSDFEGAVIDPRACLLFSPRQYVERETWNAKKSPYNFVPLPFDPQAEIEWSPLWSLREQSIRWLPTAFCYYDYPQSPERTFCVACSNGCAAGNTLEEAILQGFFELIERDSVALWWYNRVRRPGVDLSTFDESYLGELTEYLASRQREMTVIDITADLPIPVFACWSRRTDSEREEIVLGFGAHLDPRIALLRAVTEMNQMLSYLLHTPADKVFSGDRLTDDETVHWLKTATGENQPYLLPATDAAPRTLADYHTSFSDDVTQDVLDCQSLLARQGLDMLVLDQTRPEIGLPVAKVVVPGLRHFWARFAPGRLYDVPVTLGWLPEPRAEDELNPIPMFL